MRSRVDVHEIQDPIPFISEQVRADRHFDRFGLMDSPLGRTVSVVTWTLLLTSTLALSGRFAIKYGLSRKWQLDDVLAMLALVRRGLRLLFLEC